MRRFLLAAIAAASMLLPYTFARADTYAKPMLALVMLDGWSDAFAAGVSIGRPVPELLPWLNVEVEFLKSFSKLERADMGLSFSKTAAFAALAYPVDPRVFIKGKAGVRYATFSGDDDENSSDTGADWGIGASYMWNPTRHLVIEYMTSDHNDFSQLTAGLQFNF